MLNSLLRGFSSIDFKRSVFSVAIAIFLVLTFLSVGCGLRKPPVPPHERVLQRLDVSGFQRGNQVILSWRMPARNAPKSSVLNVSRADIYRLAEPATAPLQLSEEEFASRSNLVATLAITDADFGLKTLSYRDTLEFANQAARLRYAIRLVNATGQKAGFSNFLLVEPAGAVAANPTSLAARVTQDGIRLDWQPPKTNIDRSTPPSVLGYNIYRSTSDKEPGKLLNKTPVADSHFDDEFFDFDKEYFYFVRAVSAGLLSEPVESLESNVVRLTPKDSFPPTAPASITVAAAPGTISIFFAVNPEKDIAGYKIYRSTDANLLKAQWTLLTLQLLKTNTFQDAKVESGKTYYYYITATDRFGNVSPVSEVVSETVP